MWIYLHFLINSNAVIATNSLSCHQSILYCSWCAVVQNAGSTLCVSLWFSRLCQELVLKSCLSPDGKYLLTLSTESKLCLYQMPSLSLVHSWSADHQPCSDKLSPALEESSRKTKYLKEHPHYYKLLDVEWWSNEVSCSP